MVQGALDEPLGFADQLAPDLYEVDAAYLALRDRHQVVISELRALSDAHHIAMTSLSWRVTRPLRLIGSAFRYLLRHR